MLLVESVDLNVSRYAIKIARLTAEALPQDRAKYARKCDEGNGQPHLQWFEPVIGNGGIKGGMSQASHRPALI